MVASESDSGEDDCASHNCILSLEFDELIVSLHSELESDEYIVMKSYKSNPRRCDIVLGCYSIKSRVNYHAIHQDEVSRTLPSQVTSQLRFWREWIICQDLIKSILLYVAHHKKNKSAMVAGQHNAPHKHMQSAKTLRLANGRILAHIGDGLRHKSPLRRLCAPTL